MAIQAHVQTKTLEQGLPATEVTMRTAPHNCNNPSTQANNLHLYLEVVLKHSWSLTPNVEYLCNAAMSAPVHLEQAICMCCRSTPVSLRLANPEQSDSHHADIEETLQVIKDEPPQPMTFITSLMKHVGLSMSMLSLRAKLH